MVNVLAGNDKTTAHMTEPLVMSLERSSNETVVKITVDSLEKVQALSDDHMKRLLSVTKSNSFVRASSREVARIKALVAKFGAPENVAGPNDEFDPFADE